MTAWDKNKCIAFKYTRSEYGELSNFYPAPLKIFDIYVPTSEHLYQALKFNDANIQHEIIKASSPSQAKSIAHNAPYDKMVRTSLTARLSIMDRVLRIKFRQHPDLLQILLNTMPYDIVENSSKDKTWGANLHMDGYYYGENNLGQLLMKTRDNASKNSDYLNKPWVLKRSTFMGYIVKYNGENSEW